MKANQNQSLPAKYPPDPLNLQTNFNAVLSTVEEAKSSNQVHYCEDDTNNPIASSNYISLYDAGMLNQSVLS